MFISWNIRFKWMTGGTTMSGNLFFVQLPEAIFQSQLPHFTVSLDRLGSHETNRWSAFQQMIPIIYPQYNWFQYISPYIYIYRYTIRLYYIYIIFIPIHIHQIIFLEFYLYIPIYIYNIHIGYWYFQHIGIQKDVTYPNIDQYIYILFIYYLYIYISTYIQISQYVHCIIPVSWSGWLHPDIRGVNAPSPGRMTQLYQQEIFGCNGLS